MRLTKAERAAAMAVVTMTAAVVTAGVKLIRRHTDYMLQKAAAHFKDDEIKEGTPAQGETPDAEPEENR